MAKILVIEDDLPLLNLYMDMLQMMGHTPLKAENGWEGLELARKEGPDLIILDIKLPDITGFSVLETLKTSISTKGIPIIIASVFSDLQDLNKAKALGASDYIVKPVLYEDLKNRIEKVFSSTPSFYYFREESAIILLLEDNLKERDLMLSYLKDEPYRAIPAITPQEMFEFIKAFDIDLILIDASILQENELLEMIKLLKKSPSTKMIPLVSIADDEKEAIKLCEMGIDDCLKKSVRPELLKLIIKNLLQKKLIYEEYININQFVNVLLDIVEDGSLLESHHAEKVKAISLMIGKRAGLKEKELKILEMAAIFHDIGKIMIDKNLLNKKEPLTNDEFSLIKKHAEFSEEIIDSIAKFKEVAHIIRHHHEKKDGSGYPDNLKSMEIPLLSKIVGIADAYEAMTSDRPYRRAFSSNEALNILYQEASDNKWERYLIDVLKEVLEETFEIK